MGNLKQRAINASIWTLGGHAAGQAMRLGTNLIMTRLLVPEMFGVMSIVTVVIVGLACKSASKAALFEDAGDGGIKRRDVENINAYLVSYSDLVVEARSAALSELAAT